MSPGREFEHVEQPFLDQLVSMGWKHTTGNLDHATTTGRENFPRGAHRDSPHLQIEIDKVRTGSKRLQRVDEDVLQRSTSGQRTMGRVRPCFPSRLRNSSMASQLLQHPTQSMLGKMWRRVEHCRSQPSDSSRARAAWRLSLCALNCPAKSRMHSKQARSHGV